MVEKKEADIRMVAYAIIITGVLIALSIVFSSSHPIVAILVNST